MLKTVHTAFECTITMGEALINLVHQYPALWDKQDAKYKDSNYKDAKWRECETKNIKAKSGDGLTDCKPKWKYYNIMSLIDITLLKQRYVPIYLTTYLTYIQNTYIHTYNRQLSMILIQSIQEKSYKIINVCLIL